MHHCVSDCYDWYESEAIPMLSTQYVAMKQVLVILLIITVTIHSYHSTNDAMAETFPRYWPNVTGIHQREELCKSKIMIYFRVMIRE